MRFLNYDNAGRLWRVYGRSALRYTTARKLWNGLRTEWAYRRRVTYVKSRPYILFLEPLYYCNLECPLCDRQIFPSARENSAGKLSLEMFDRLLDEAADYLIQIQIFGQGEPLLDWPRTKAIIEKSHTRRIFTLLSTNCTLVTAKTAEEIVSCGLDYLVCAIDGVSQQSYQQYRTGGKVSDALAGLKMIAAQRLAQRSQTQIEWQFLVHRGNVHEIDTAKKMAAELEIYIRFSPLHGMEFDRSLQAAWLPDSNAWQDGRIQNGDVVHPWPCYFLWRAAVLNSNGKVARCLIYQNVAEYADLNTCSLGEAYNHPSVQRARALFRKAPVPEGDFPQPCGNCSFFQREHGGPNLDKHRSLGFAPASSGEVGEAASHKDA